MKQERIYIYGKHAVEEATKHHIKIEKLNPKATFPSDIDPEVNHQGVIASVFVSDLMKDYKNFIKKLTITPDTALIILGELQDPQNVGAVIRSAGAFGIAGILIPEHNQAQISGAVVKVSAGMAFSVPLISIGNINNVIRDLKDKGFWIYGLEGTAEVSLDGENFEEPSVFVLGNEAKGIREKTREICDIMLRIPIHPRCESMNVASSTSVVLYKWSTKHPNALS